MIKTINSDLLAGVLDEHAIVSMTDAAGNIIYVNQKFIDISGYPLAELEGQNHRMLKSGLHPPGFYRDMWDTLLSGQTWHGEVCNRRKSGALYWVRATVKPIVDSNGLPVQYLSIRTDITAIKHAEENSRRSQVLMRNVIDAIPDMIFFKDREGKYLGCNKAFEQYFGAPEPHIVGKTDFDFVDPNTASFFREQDELMLASGKPRLNEETITYPDGKTAFIEMLKSPYEYGGESPGVIGIGHDVTERKQQLAAIQDAESRWSFAVEGAGDGVWDWDMRTGRMHLSKMYEEMLGYSQGELPQTVEAWQRSVHPEDLARIQQQLQEYLTGKVPAYTPELRLQCKAGGYKWILCRGQVVERDDKGMPIRMIGIHSDIDERKKSELQLELFREMIEYTGQPIFLIDVGDNYRLAYVNQAAIKHWGASKEELLTWKLPDWDPSYDFKKVETRFAQTVNKPGVLIETEHRLKDGRIVPVEVFTNARMIAGKPYTFGSFQNIEERKKNEESLKLFRRIFETSEQAIGIADANGILVYINKAHERMHRVRLEDVAGKHFSIFLAEQALALAPAIMAATNIGESWVGLLPQKRGDGSEFLSSSHIGALMSRDGKPQFLFNILYDYTDEQSRQQELKSARDKAELANKAKSDFLSSMSHELRTPMNAILGFAQLMEGDQSCTPDQRENLQQISKAGWHLLDLINEVLDLAKVESGTVKLEIEDIDAGSIISECLSLVSPLLSEKKISVDNRVASIACRVHADYMRLKQVLINLLSNAIKYNRDRGLVTIDAECDSNDWVTVTVRDTGRGITPRQMENIFEPFTRFGDTDKVHGTGIGLSICKKLIESMGGKILVSSTEGVGSIFSIVLPKGEAGLIQQQHHSESISLLYIEDDSAQQSLIGKWAHNKSWSVEFAHDAASGIDAAMNCPHDAILLDIDLPGGFSGLDVKSVLDDMESLRATPVIGISNMVQPEDVARAMQMGFAAYLAKPVDLLELERTLQKTIRGRGKSCQTN
jgi:PAS domain S-box-containing protein